MEKIFQELIAILDEQKYSFNGLSIYLLTDEEEPYKLYKLNMSTNEDIKKVINKNIKKAKDAQLYEYPENTVPDGSESVSYIKENEVPGYDKFKELIIKDNSINLSKRIFEQIEGNIKGFVINAVITRSSDGKEMDILFFSTLDKSNLYQPKAGLYRFGSEEGDVLKKSRDTYLELKDNCCAINFNGVVFVVHGHYFERLFNYEEHINVHATTTVKEISNLGLISNCEILEEHCTRNKNFKKKLYGISTANKLDNVTFDTFKALKKTIGEGLFFKLDQKNKSITIDEGNKHKSVDQIIRIINDEAAETLVSKTQIFANQRIKIFN
ncbi:Kiwa anti-phage protein KwaB-like domain-containing protein [Virgibacillus siamensis]|uniref:Kiwa anti-phage protein KwaB-like domain-containing protein n=1 Tax=Virgibacillus siamensis TaxID=480071 RepID=UPI000985B0B5|nr:Kiwa anti-phage protein KwaB-like domain-containing protein [Virgibacillus siamensis]